MSANSESIQPEAARGASPRAVGIWFAFTWLIFTSFFFIKFFYVTPPTWEIALTAIVFAVFLAAYALAFRNYERPRGLRLPAAVIIALGVIMAPINPGANVFFSYPAWFLGRAYPTRQAVAVVIGLATLVVLVTLSFDLDINFFLPAFLLSLGLGLMSVALRRLEHTQQALGQSREEAAHLARIAERERIARDLHDTVGHSLSVIALKSELAAEIAADESPEASAEMRAVNAVARQSLSEIRATLSGYWELSLAAELESLKSALNESGIDCSLNIADAALTPAVETALAMSFREGVTNVIRHSEARRATLTLTVDGKDVIATIEDDGIGLGGDPGIGLTGVRRRIEQMNGHVTIDGQSGTRLEVRLPAQQPA